MRLIKGKFEENFFSFNVNDTDRSRNSLSENEDVINGDINHSYNHESPFLFPSIHEYKLENPRNIKIGHLNVNSVRNKFLAIKELIQDKVDICFLSETKIDESFPNQQFHINGYKLFRRDRNKYGGGLLLYVKENIPCKLLQNPTDMELLILEFSIKNIKWLCIGLYRPPNENEKYFIENLMKILNQQSCLYDRTVLIGDFNLTTQNKNLEILMNTFDLETLIKEPTCFQSENASCIDLILTNKKETFKNSKVFEVGISDHHSFIITSLKMALVKGNAKTKLYRKYKDFNIENFQKDLTENLKNDANYYNFHKTFLKILDKHAPLKKKILRFDDNLFMTKELRKGIMHRSKLKNKFNKNRTNENWENYRRQRNLCVNTLRKSKRDYFQNLNSKNFSDNRTFWKTIKPYFTNKGLNSNKLLLKEGNKIISNEKELANIMNNYFVNITQELNLKNHTENTREIEKNVKDIKLDFQAHPSIKKIKDNFNITEYFSFHQVTELEVRKEIENLNNSKATPTGDIPVKTLKLNIDIILPTITKIINNSFIRNDFPDLLKSAEVRPIF